MNDAGVHAELPARRGQPPSVTTRAILIDESSSAVAGESTLIGRIADIVRHWRAGLVGGLVVGAIATAWQANESRKQQLVALLENASMPAEAGIAPIAKQDLAAMITAMAMDHASGSSIPADSSLDATAPKVGDMVRIVIVLRSADAAAAKATAQQMVDWVQKSIDDAFKPRLSSAEAYLKAQIEITNQSVAQVEALIAEKPDPTGKSDRADLVQRANELRARVGALQVRSAQLAGPKLISGPTLQDDVGLVYRSGLVALAAAVGALAFSGCAAVAEKVRRAMHAS